MAKDFLKNNKTILILQPDKCNKIIILDKAEYNTEMNILLADIKAYNRVKRI